MRQVANAAKTRMLFNSTLSGVRDDESGARSHNAVEELSKGRDMTGVAQVGGSGALVGMQALIPFRTESWLKFREMSLDARISAIQDSNFRQKLAAEAIEADVR